MLIPFKFQNFVLASFTLACMSLPTLAQNAREAKVKQLIEAAKADSNNYQFNSGRIPNSDIFYASFCSASHMGKAFLVRNEDSEAPTVYERDWECISKVSWRDIDGDGTPEIRLTAHAGGTGVSHTKAIFYKWEEDASEPFESAQFLEYGRESWDGAYRYYKFEPEEWYPFTFHKESFLPVGAKCPNTEKCEIKQRNTFCIDECEKAVPKSMRSHKDWPKFVEALITDGFEPGNKEIATSTPEEDAEKQAAFDSWLSE